MKVSLEALAPDDLPVTVTLPEFMRRMKEMSYTSGMNNMMGMFPETFNVIVNSNHPLIVKLTEASEDVQSQKAKQVYDLALLSQGLLTGNELTSFIKRSVQLAGE